MFGRKIKWFILSFLAIILFLIPPRACLGEDTNQQGLTHTQYEYGLVIGSYVKHFKGEDHVEGFKNRIMAFSYNNWTIAEFRNSYGNETAFFGKGYYLQKLGNPSSLWARGGVLAGLLCGYGREHPLNIGGLGPGVFPVGEIGYKRTSLVMGVLPNGLFWALKVEF